MNPYISYPIIYRHEIKQFAQDVKNQKRDRQARKEAKHNRKFPQMTTVWSALAAVGLVGLNATAFV